jgi:hypothetical protein
LETTVADRTGGDAADVQEEILAAACNALDKAHDLLSLIVRYEGKCTPPFVERCKEWVDGEYDPGTRQAKRCKHNWAKTALASDMYCTRCGVPRSVGCQ